MAAEILLVYGHPYPDRSGAGHQLLDAVRDLPDLTVRSLYELYPEFWIDVEAEQAALTRAEIVVWQCPCFWYGMPALFHLWFEKVLTHGWAHGDEGNALRGKRALWVTTTGGHEGSYAPDGAHERPFDVFIPPVEQTARFCGMRWQPPLVVHAAHRMKSEELASVLSDYRARLVALQSEAT